MYIDILKETIKHKINNVLNIPVKDTIVTEDKLEDKKIKFPKLLVSEKIDSNTIKVIDLHKYDTMGVEETPVLKDIVGLYVCNTTVKSLVKSYDNGIIMLEDDIIDSIVEYIDEFTIESSDEDCKIENKDYIYITSLHNFNRKLNYNVSEVYRRFEIGLFCYDDPDESKCNKYMDILRDEFESDFKLLNSNDSAYIFNPMKFDVVENGKLNRVIYGSIMIRTYKTK